MNFTAGFFNHLAPRIGRLALLKSAGTDTPAGCCPAGKAVSAGALAHEFSVWQLKTGTAAQPAIHLHLCRRCGWLFKADDRCRYVIALDQEARALAGAAAAERLATFSSGPCPARTRLTTTVRLTQTVNTAGLLYLRFIAVAASISEALRSHLRRRPSSVQQAF